MSAVSKVMILVALPLLGAALFSGQYDDPNHPGCARVITFETETTAKVFGADAAGGEGVACDGKTDVMWGPLPALISGNEISVDFSSKGGPTDLAGKYSEDPAQINWQDGNVWPKICPSSFTTSANLRATAAADVTKRTDPSLINGKYSDPNHPSCFRTVLATTSTSADIFGADAAGGEGASCDGATDSYWHVPATVATSELGVLSIVADFSSKGGPADLAGVYNALKSEIDWSDGNMWPKDGRHRRGGGDVYIGEKRTNPADCSVF